MSLDKPGKSMGESPVGGGPNGRALLFHSRRLGKRGTIDRLLSQMVIKKEVKYRDKRIPPPRF